MPTSGSPFDFGALPSRRSAANYPVLTFLVVAYYAAAAVVALGSLGWAGVILTAAVKAGRENKEPGVTTGGVLAGGAITVMILVAVAEVIRLSLDAVSVLRQIRDRTPDSK